MYATALLVHSFLRLAVVLLCAWLAVRGLRGTLGVNLPRQGSRLLFVLVTIAADLQLVIGLLLYFLWSPDAAKARENMGAAMKDPTLRFWVVEHPAAMLLGIVLVHVGKIAARKAQSDGAYHRRTLIFFGLALLVFLAMSPAPWSSVVRPVLRMPG